jgi:hypothetical protein
MTRSGVVQVERGGLLVAPGGAKAEGRVVVDDPEAKRRAGGVRARGYCYWRGTRAGR